MVLFKNADITIYNRYFDNTTGTDKYKRTVIKGVNWQEKRNATVSDKGLNIAYNTLIFMDKLEDYREPKSFAKNPQEGFTLANGDIIVKGICEDEVTGVKPYRIADIVANNVNVITIKGVSNLTGHFEIEGV